MMDEMTEHFGNSWRLVVSIDTFYAACENQELTILPVHPLMYYNTWKLHNAFRGRDFEYWNEVYTLCMARKAGELYV